MPISTICPSCRAKVKAPDGAAGQILLCPRCREEVHVPLLSGPEDHSDLPMVLSSYIQVNLMPGEHLIRVTHIHPMVLVAPGILAILGLLLGMIGVVLGNGGTALTVIGF